LEHIAKRVCERRGLDAYESVPQAGIPGCDILVWQPRWQAIADEVQNYLVLREVLIEELGAPA
jgi:hypothetical protein